MQRVAGATGQYPGPTDGPPRVYRKPADLPCLATLLARADEVIE